MKKSKIVSLYRGLSALGDLRGARFAYAVTKNLSLLESEIQALQKAQTPSDKFNEYEKERIKLAEKHAKKEDGKPVIANNEYVLEDQEAFDKDFKKLQEKHKEAIDQHKKQLEEVQKILDEETDIKLHKIKIEDLPENISTRELKSIEDILDEDTTAK